MALAWNDLGPAVGGFDLGATEWKILTRQTALAFARTTDFPEFDPSGPVCEEYGWTFDGSSAVKFLLLSMMPILLAELISFPPGASVLSYGLNRLQFGGLIHIGERYRGRFVVKSRNRISPTREILKVWSAIESDVGSRPALVADPLIALVDAGAPLFAAAAPLNADDARG